MNSLESVIDQMAFAGIRGLLPGDLEVDGQIHRFRPEGANGRTGWYCLFEFAADGGRRIVTGSFGDWRLGEKGTKVLLSGEPLSDEDRDRLKKQAATKKREQDKIRNARAGKAALRAKTTWDKLSAKGESSYLTRKRVQGYGVRFTLGGSMAIPLVDVQGGLHGLQVIRAKPRETKSGDFIEKEFWPYGMDPKGRFHVIGDIEAGDFVVVCEGYATGASIHEATGLPVVVAFNAGNLMLVCVELRAAFPHRELVVAADDDYLTKRPMVNPGLMLARKVAAKVTGCRVVLPTFSHRNGEKWTDFNDMHGIEGIKAVRQHFQPGEEPPWQLRFSQTKDGNVKANVNNVRLVLEHDERWKGVLRYSDFHYTVMKVKPPPFEHSAEVGEWKDADTARLRCWLEEEHGFSPRTSDADDAILVSSQANHFHPVRDYLNGLVWDGEVYVKTWLSDFLGAPDTPYTRAVSVKWLVSAVARAMRPPVKVDCVMILEGLQGKGKSTALEILANGWFSDTHFDIGHKDGYQQMRGVWIYELAELDAFNKAESTRAKGFFSAVTDNYRASYAKRNESWPRQCVYSGTTNQEQYLTDASGNRRYWPVECTDIDFDGLRKYRDRLWAEAVHLYKEGTVWWVTDDELHLFEKQQERRFQEDVWESEIQAWLYDPVRRTEPHFTGADIMRGALKMDAAHMDKPKTTRVGNILKRLKWLKKQVRVPNTDRRVRVYMRPDEIGGDV